MKKSLVVAVVTLMSLSSCTTTEEVAVVNVPMTTRPYETSVEKIFNLRTGMKLADVSATLGCQPIEFYFDGSTGCKIVEYRYRRKYHNIYEQSDIRYRDDKKLYALFYDDMLREIITTSGQEMSIPLMVDEVNIRDACTYDARPITKKYIVEKYLSGSSPAETEKKKGLLRP